MYYKTLLKKLKGKHEEAKQDGINYDRSVYAMPMNELASIICALEKIIKMTKEAKKKNVGT